MKKLFALGIILVLAFSFAYAAKETATGEAGAETTNEKQQTYGQCVSAAADLKNTCYSTTKDQKNACLSAVNESDKDGSKTCKADYKKSMDSCKKDFKQAKSECKKIKHGMWETMRYSMK